MIHWIILIGISQTSKGSCARGLRMESNPAGHHVGSVTVDNKVVEQPCHCPLVVV
jgi:hypothetical protein